LTLTTSCCARSFPTRKPEQYQVRLGRVARLRDLLNGCIENPARGKPLADDGPKLRAREAYLSAKRKGTALEYGKK